MQTFPFTGEGVGQATPRVATPLPSTPGSLTEGFNALAYAHLTPQGVVDASGRVDSIHVESFALYLAASELQDLGTPTHEVQAIYDAVGFESPQIAAYATLELIGGVYLGYQVSRLMRRFLPRQERVTLPNHLKRILG